EHVLGKDEVTGSNPVISSIKKETTKCSLFFYSAGRSLRSAKQLHKEELSNSIVLFLFRWAFATLG
ncbi:MAG: hypothetical protein IKM16_00320, partial [Clostridia bacterium]|nr:hypothetical protein [Clostridia bacterium]